MARVLKDDHSGRFVEFTNGMLRHGSVDALRALGIDLSQVKREWLVEVVDELKVAETDLTEFRRMLEGFLADADRSCEVCGGPVAGRSDRRYCGTTCRQRAHRAR